MNIENILSFIYVYRYGSFHKAANMLYVTQPSLSSRIRTLEKELNTQLFSRDRSHMALTEDGKLFLPYAIQIVNTYSQAQDALNKQKSKIIIGANVSVSTTILPYVIEGFRQRYPSITIEISSGMPDELAARVLAGECDMILTQAVCHPDLVGEVVYRDPAVLVAPPGHALTKQKRLHVTEVAMEPMIHNTLLPTFWEQILAHFKKQGVAPNIVLDVDSLEVTKKMIMKGIGISYLPLLPIEEELSQKKLVVLRPIPKLELYREIWLLYPQGKQQLYKDQIVEMIGKYTPVLQA